MKTDRRKTKHLPADVGSVLLLPQPYSYPQVQPDWKFPKFESSHQAQNQ